jgi:carbon storage regulator
VREYLLKTAKNASTETEARTDFETRPYFKEETSMLVLSRKIGERIVVPGCKLEIAVVAVNGKTVRLGISAPPEVEVHREEVWRADQPTHVPPRARKPE